MGLTALEALKQFDGPADRYLVLVIPGTAVFCVDMRRADLAFLVVSDEPNPAPYILLVQPVLDDWLQVCSLCSLIRMRLLEDEGQEEALPFDRTFKVELVSQFFSGKAR